MVPAVAKIQFSLDLEPALTDQFRSFREVLAAAVYGARCGLNGVASHCDLSPSALSRMLNFNEDDPRHLPADLVPKILEVTGDMRPVHWLIARFLPDDETRSRAAVAQIQASMPALLQALATLEGKKKR